MSKLISTLFVVFFAGWVGTANALPIFYLSPGSDPNGDLAFQSAVSGQDFYEEDFDSYAGTLGGLTLGGVSIDFSVGSGSADPQVFYGAYTSAGGVYGTVFDGALLKNSSQEPSITFTFAEDNVSGFGIWAFSDSAATDDAYQLSVEDVAGNTWTSSTLDVTSTSWEVEGFLGVTHDTGIRSVTVIDLVGGGAFELDHLQLATSSEEQGSDVPVPETVPLFALGLAGLGWTRRRKA